MNKPYMNIIRTFFISLLVAASSQMIVGQAIAEDAMSSADEWKFSAAIYGFLVDVETTSPSGDTIAIDFDTFLDNLDLYFSGALDARKGKLLLMADFFYYKGSGDADLTTTKPSGITGQKKLTEETDIDMKNYFITFAGGYNLLKTDKASMDILLGARYLNLDMDVELDVSVETNLPISDRDIIKQAAGNLSVDGDVWDAIVGVRGEVTLNKDWYLAYLADYGGGDSERTWQVYGAVSRKFGWGDVMLGYRHLEYEFDDAEFIKELEYDGPVVGAKFYF